MVAVVAVAVAVVALAVVALVAVVDVWRTRGDKGRRWGGFS